MSKREQSTGERISSLVFFIAGLWLVMDILMMVKGLLAFQV
jgi:hypothetical protein